MQNKSSEILIDYIIDTLDEYFRGRIAGYTVLEQMDRPYIAFSFQFIMYNYFNVVFSYDRGRFGCSIINGDVGIGIESSLKWYDKADMDLFCQELEQQIELRIPDKFLEYHGWK